MALKMSSRCCVIREAYLVRRLVVQGFSMIRSTTTSEYATSCSTAFYWFMNCKLGCGWHVTRLMGFVAGAWLLRCFDEARDRVWGQATVVEMIGRNTQDSILSQTRISCSQDESAANSPNKTSSANLTDIYSGTPYYV
jgi:hypothetical protein